MAHFTKYDLIPGYLIGFLVDKYCLGLSLSDKAKNSAIPTIAQTFECNMHYDMVGHVVGRYSVGYCK